MNLKNAYGFEHLTYDPWIWLKVTYMAFTASNRNNAQNQQSRGFLTIHSTFRDQSRSFWC